MGKATKQATASINKIRSINKSNEKIKLDELRIQREASQILKSSQINNPNIFIEADYSAPLIIGKTILDFVKADERINTTIDFFYPDNSGPDKGIEAQVLLKTPSSQRVVPELFISYEYGDYDKVLFRGGIKLDPTHTISLSCSSPFRGMLNLKLGVLKTASELCPVLSGTWSESDQGELRTGFCRIYL